MNRARLFLFLLISLFLVTDAFAQDQLSRSGVKHRTVFAPPTPEAIVEVHYDGENYDAIGLTSTGTFEVSARFTPTQLALLTGGSLIQVKVYINDIPNSATLKIYDNGTETNPGLLLHSQPMTDLTGMDWNTITLTTPVAIDGNDLWVGYELTHTAGIYPAGFDAGPANPNGDWVYFSGTWQHMAGLGFNYNWNVRALIEDPSGGPGAPTNPNPANGATGVLNLTTLSWENPVGTSQNEVIFNGTTIYTGAAVTSVPVPGPLAFNTTYYWRVNAITGTGTSNGPEWLFKTARNPNLPFCDDFYTLDWTVIGPLGNSNWSVNTSNHAGGASPELEFNWNPIFIGVSKLLSQVTNNPPAGFPVYLTFRHMVDWYATTFTLGVGYTIDGGTNITTLWTISPTGNVGPEPVSVPTFISPGNFQFVIWFSGDSFEIDYWYIDDFCTGMIPVELSSFTALAVNGTVSLNWTTATETNNKGFEVQRKVNGSDYSAIDFIVGHGTTTQLHNYTYSDLNLRNGKYTYRLKQIDHNSTYEYSNEVEVDVNTPAEFTLSQNYPNPFNPSTTISYSIPEGITTKVTLKIYDILGIELAILVNEKKPNGEYQVEWDASAYPSGVYFYRLQAGEFTSTKKLLLMK